MRSTIRSKEDRRNSHYAAPACTPKLFAVVIACLTVFALSSHAADSPAWRLDDSLNLPEGFSVSGAFRSRFENAHNTVRSGTPNDQVLTLRTRIDAKYVNNGRVWQVEVMDARQ